jgi:hypothetical protein
LCEVIENLLFAEMFLLAHSSLYDLAKISIRGKAVYNTELSIMEKVFNVFNDQRVLDASKNLKLSGATLLLHV